MARYTRSCLNQIARADQSVSFLVGDKVEKLPQAINSLVSGFVNQGLEFVDDTWSKWEHTSGRPEQAYEGREILVYLNRYLASVPNHKINLRKATALALKSHFEFLGYDGDNPLSRAEAFWADVARTRKLKKEKKKT